MTYRINKSIPVFVLVSMITLLPACQMFWSPQTPEGYAMPRPEKTILEKKVNEVSGLCYLSDKDGFLAVADDKQKIYQITAKGKVSNYFAEDIGDGAADYEDIVKKDSSVFVLISNGNLKEVKKGSNGLEIQVYSSPVGGENDFETLYYDASANSLIMLCKKCEAEKGKKVRTAYRFDLVAKKWDAAPYYTISSKDINHNLKDGDIEFDPSGAAIHPIEKRLYILSSAGNLMVITDLRGKVESAYRLNSVLYPQAEGITFAPNGDMYITNEAKLGKPTLLKLVYQPNRK